MDWITDIRVVGILVGVGFLVGAAFGAMRWHAAGPGHRLRGPYVFDTLVLAGLGAFAVVAGVLAGGFAFVSLGGQ